MEFLRLLTLFLHFIGLAVLLGSFLMQIRQQPSEGRWSPGTGMLPGALTQLLTGVILVGLLQGVLHLPVDNMKIVVKLLILVAILALVLIGRRKPLVTPAFMSIGLLTVLNVGIAVFWT